ncbi:MAG: phosphoribosylglycinamide formyltransferase [Planctomycetota bacterium]|jgi:phosphoribosylglycinamide formyltransferase-1
MLDVAVTFSGGGRTVLNLLEKIEAGELDARIVLAVTDRDCKGIGRIEAKSVAVERIPWTKGTTVDEYASKVWPRIEAAGAQLVCFCGFLRLLKIPDAWEDRVMNIHPALLPKFGGKGMWGDHVHRAVLEAGESESGCTVHFANNEYDKGPIIVQKRVPVLPDDTADSLAARVFLAECEAYPEAVRLFGEGRLKVENGKVTIL